MVINKLSLNQFWTKRKLFDDGECPICYSTPQVDKAILPCGHVYCFQCLKKWSDIRKLRATCPVCNTALSEIANDNGKFTPVLLLCWIVILVTLPWVSFAFVLRRSGILGFLFNLTGIICAILQISYLLIFGFLPLNTASQITIINILALAIFTLIMYNSNNILLVLILILCGEKHFQKIAIVILLLNLFVF